MRILVLTSTYPRWPGDREPPFVFELCRRLALRHEVLVIAPHCAGAVAEEKLGNLSVQRFRYAPERLQSLAYEGGILEKLRRARWRYLLVPLFLLSEWAAALRAIRQLRPDVIHAHWIIPQGLIALLARLGARGKPPPVVCTSHGADLFALRGPLASRLKAWVVRRAALLTVVSAVMAAQATRLGAAPGRVRVMPMGVDARERFVPGKGERLATEVLFVGRLVAKKGVVHLLQAFAGVRASFAAARLTIIGTGPLERELRSQARELGIEPAVTFAGALPNEELPRHYQRAAVVAVPSVVAQDGDQEGLGLVIAEALACECPVVASDLPAITDIIEDGVTGLLARQGDAQDLGAKIVRLLHDPAHARALARRGRAVVLDRFDWESVGRGYAEVLSAAGRFG